MPTEKRRGRPKTTEPVTLLARLDKAFADEVRGYAEQYRVPVSLLIRDGLRWRISGDPNTHPPVDTEPPAPSNNAEGQTIAAQLRHIAAVLDQCTLPSSPPYAPVIQVLHADTEDIVEESSVIHVMHEGSTPPGYDEAKFYLGNRPCPKGHTWGDTGRALLRRRNQGCRQCDNEKKRLKRQQAK